METAPSVVQAHPFGSSTHPFPVGSKLGGTTERDFFHETSDPWVYPNMGDAPTMYSHDISDTGWIHLDPLVKSVSSDDSVCSDSAIACYIHRRCQYAQGVVGGGHNFHSPREVKPWKSVRSFQRPSVRSTKNVTMPRLQHPPTKP